MFFCRYDINNSLVYACYDFAFTRRPKGLILTENKFYSLLLHDCMTTKSSIQSIKSRLPRNHSVNSTITNDNDIKSRRIHANKSLSIPNTSLHKLTANSFSNHLKKRTAQLNKFFHSKLKSNHSNEHTNELQSNEQSISTSVISHITVLSEEMNNLPRNDNGEAKVLFFFSTAAISSIDVDL